MSKQQGSGVAAWLKERQANQPSFGAELRAMFRQGREDLLNNILPAFPGQPMTREAGAPGTPTPQQTTQALEGREVNPKTDVIAKEVPNHKGQTQLAEERTKAQEELERMRGNERDGREM